MSDSITQCTQAGGEARFRCVFRQAAENAQTRICGCLVEPSVHDHALQVVQGQESQRGHHPILAAILPNEVEWKSPGAQPQC